MKRFWFRICFERKFDNKEQAEEYLDTITEQIIDVDELSVDMERRSLKKQEVSNGK